MRIVVSFEDGWNAELALAQFVAGFKSLNPLTGWLASNLAIWYVVLMHGGCNMGFLPTKRHRCWV